VKDWTSIPSSLLRAAATSNNVVSTGSVLRMFPWLVWNRKRVSAYADAGLEVTGPDEVGAGAAGAGCGGAWPARSAFSRSAFKRLSSLSAAIFALIRALASISSCFSFRFLAASLICSFRCRSSLMS
jgi:hypothetical protein